MSFHAFEEAATLLRNSKIKKLFPKYYYLFFSLNQTYSVTIRLNDLVEKIWSIGRSHKRVYWKNNEFIIKIFRKCIQHWNPSISCRESAALSSPNKVRKINFNRLYTLYVLFLHQILWVLWLLAETVYIS